MNFFTHQDKARSNTTKLVALFALAVFSLIVITQMFVVVAYAFSRDIEIDANLSFGQLLLKIGPDTFLYIALTIIGVVFLAWLYKSIQLSNGGRSVAESLNGKRIPLNTDDKDEKKVLNVVEEMAIASGIAVPPVYVLEEHGINAFAAGYSTKDAVIGITRGCISSLNREELQGVIAHEFSHIFNGDMRLNIRLVSVLHGILVIGMIGEVILDSTFNIRTRRRHRSSDDDSRGGGHVAFALFGLGLYIIGYLGHFFGSMIKAAVSREREFLADASAVQFTRNPEGIGNALRKIGGYPLGAYITHAESHEFSHIFFCNSLRKSLFSALATHPPIKERIRRVDPSGGTRFIKVTLPEEAKINPYLLKESRKGIDIDPEAYKEAAPIEKLAPLDYVNALAGGAAVAATSAMQLEKSIEYSGVPTVEHVNEAKQILQGIPEVLGKSARDPYDVQALAYGLLLDQHRAEVHEQQLQYLQTELADDVYRELIRIKDHVSVMPPRHRLPLMDIAIATLKQLSKAQYTDFKRHLTAMIKADKVVDLLEWSMYRMITHHLEDKANSPIGRKSLPALHADCQRLLSAVALASTETLQAAKTRFNCGWEELGLAPADLIEDALEDMARLDHAVKRANLLHPLKKPQLIKACCTSLHNNDDPEGLELIRIISDSLDVPMPPLIAEQAKTETAAPI